MNNYNERIAQLKNLTEKCFIDASAHICEATDPALNQAVQEINQSLCSIFTSHLLNQGIDQPPTDHDKLVTQMKFNGDPPIDNNLAEYLYEAHEILRASAYHQSSFPPHYETLIYFCVAEAIFHKYGFRVPYNNIQTDMIKQPLSRIIRLLPIEELAYAYIDYGATSIRFQLKSITTNNDSVFYYPYSWEVTELDNSTGATHISSPLGLGDLYFWALSDTEKGKKIHAINANWALNLVRKRFDQSKINVEMIKSETCYFGTTKGIMLHVKLKYKSSPSSSTTYYGLYAAIGVKPSIEMLFVGFRIGFNIFLNLIRACMFSSHISFYKNGKLVKKVVASLKDSIRQHLTYNNCEISRMWEGKWFYLGEYPHIFIPDFEVIEGNETIGYGVILTQRKGLKLVVEKWSRIGNRNLLFLVIPQELNDKATELCQYRIPHREIISYNYEGNLSWPHT